MIRDFHGVEPHAPRCGSSLFEITRGGSVRFLFFENRIRCGAVRCGAVFTSFKSIRCGAYGAVRCEFHFFKIIRCGAARIMFFKNRTVRCGAVIR